MGNLAFRQFHVLMLQYRSKPHTILVTMSKNIIMYCPYNFKLNEHINFFCLLINFEKTCGPTPLHTCICRAFKLTT